MEINSLYIHIPFCISKCAYCDFFSRAYTSVPDEYITALCNEISYRIKFYKISVLKTIYIGGGTPSLLNENQFQKLFSHIKSQMAFSSDVEITVEVNPDDVSSSLLETLQSCGVNRISCGIQSMNDAALKTACRRADSAANKNALSLLKNYWQGDVSVDLISGLPGDDETALLKSLEEVCAINPSHISLYSLTIEDETPFGKKLSCGQLSYDFDKADKLWLYGRDFLEAHGYKWYEVSNFCKDGKECRHNLAYWTHRDYLGCGSGATGTVYNNDGSALRWTNTTDIEKYISFWNETVGDAVISESGSDGDRNLNEDLFFANRLSDRNLSEAQTGENIEASVSEFEFFMMELRKTSGFMENEFERIFNKPLPQKFLYLFEKWEGNGLCVRRKIEGEGGVRYCMSREGMLFLNRFLEELC